MLDHSRPGAGGRDRPDGGGHRLEARVVGDAAGARAALVDGEDDACGLHAQDRNVSGTVVRREWMSLTHPRGEPNA